MSPASSPRHRWRSRLLRRSVQAALRASTWLARHPTLQGLTEPAMRLAARVTIAARGLRPEVQVQAMAEAWQRAFLRRKEVPIVEVRADTAVAEIHTPCPLRDSGDVQACHRMMAYDRTIAARVGAQFVVLESQAEPGTRVCRVALRPLGQPASDLIPAHERFGRSRAPA